MLHLTIIALFASFATAEVTTTVFPQQPCCKIPNVDKSLNDQIEKFWEFKYGTNTTKGHVDHLTYFGIIKDNPKYTIIGCDVGARQTVCNTMFNGELASGNALPCVSNNKIHNVLITKMEDLYVNVSAYKNSTLVFQKSIEFKHYINQYLNVRFLKYDRAEIVLNQLHLIYKVNSFCDMDRRETVYKTISSYIESASPETSNRVIVFKNNPNKVVNEDKAEEPKDDTPEGPNKAQMIAQTVFYILCLVFAVALFALVSTGICLPVYCMCKDNKRIKNNVPVKQEIRVKWTTDEEEREAEVGLMAAQNKLYDFHNGDSCVLARSPVYPKDENGYLIPIATLTRGQRPSLPDRHLDKKPMEVKIDNKPVDPKDVVLHTYEELPGEKIPPNVLEVNGELFNIVGYMGGLPMLEKRVKKSSTIQGHDNSKEYDC